MSEPSVLTPTPDGQARSAPRLPLGLRQPIQVEVGAPGEGRAVRVTAVIPCYNRPQDAANLLADLGELERAGIDLHVVLVDNASEKPLSTLSVPDGLSVEHLRLHENTGGSGGFNAGIGHALGAATAPEFVWLLDSDARVERGALAALVRAMASHPELVVAGSSLSDPVTGEVFEVGGRVDRRTGLLVQPAPTPETLAREIVPSEYVAACSMLVRAGAIPDAGLMPHVFVNGDDVGWCLRLGRGDASAVGVVPASRARHPHHDKMQTWGRYYIARNAFGPIDALGLGAATRFRRALREVGRAVLQECMNRPDLARLHLAGLRDARRGDTSGPAPAGTVVFDAFEPLSRLAERIGALHRTRVTLEPGVGLSPVIAGAIDEQLRAAGLPAPSAGRGGPAGFAAEIAAAIGRLVLAPLFSRGEIAIVSARGRPRSWFRGGMQVQIVNEGSGSFIIRPVRPMACAARAVATLVRGLALSIRLAARPVSLATVPAVPARRADSGALSEEQPEVRVGAQPEALGGLNIVVLSYNRFAALERTLGALLAFRGLRGADVVVVDNGSTDGTPERLAARFPGLRCIALGENTGVAAFNRAAELCTAENLLILDDDAVPEEAALEAAVALLARRREVGAVAMHPRHPATGRGEWGFASRVDPIKGHDAWPVMGCANLVRRDAWIRAGGYEESFFLYRNDTDLALKLLALGYGVHFNPSWVAWHDSPAAAKKSVRWHHLATRNWVWLARRHGGGGLRGRTSALWGAMMGVVWAHRLAGLSPRRHVATIRGLIEGVVRRPAAAPPTSGEPWRSLLELRLGRSEKAPGRTD